MLNQRTRHYSALKSLKLGFNAIGDEAGALVLATLDIPPLSEAKHVADSAKVGWFRWVWWVGG